MRPGAVLALAVLVLAVAAVTIRLSPGPIAGPLHQALLRMQGWSRSAWPLFVLAQLAVALSGLAPASLVGLAAGAAYGPVLGMLCATASTLCAAAIAFGVARSGLRPAVARLLGRRSVLARIDRAVTEDGWRTVCLLRVSPVMPFALTSYALGLTGLSLRHYMVGTLAALPALLGYVVLGWLGGLGARDAAGISTLHVVLLLGGGIATLWASWHLSRLLRRTFRAECDPELPL